jgi:hypothetical protein
MRVMNATSRCTSSGFSISPQCDLSIRHPCAWFVKEWWYRCPGAKLLSSREEMTAELFEQLGLEMSPEVVTRSGSEGEMAAAQPSYI